MTGKIEVITGPMFSGKTTELLRRLERYILAKKNINLIKPDIDTREQRTEIATIRNKVIITPTIISPETLPKLTLLTNFSVIAIDEAQFFKKSLINFCQLLKDQGITVLVSGLDMDHLRQPFGYMGHIMAIADSVTKLTAVCSCGKEAAYTKKINNNDSIIDIGDSNKYTACCNNCYKDYKCPRCKNEEFSPGAKLCKICGYPIFERKD